MFVILKSLLNHLVYIRNKYVRTSIKNLEVRIVKANHDFRISELTRIVGEEVYMGYGYVTPLRNSAFISFLNLDVRNVSARESASLKMRRRPPSFLESVAETVTLSGIFHLQSQIRDTGLLTIRFFLIYRYAHTLFGYRECLLREIART